MQTSSNHANQCNRLDIQLTYPFHHHHGWLSRCRHVEANVCHCDRDVDNNKYENAIFMKTPFAMRWGRVRFARWWGRPHSVGPYICRYVDHQGTQWKRYSIVTSHDKNSFVLFHDVIVDVIPFTPSTEDKNKYARTHNYKMLRRIIWGAKKLGTKNYRVAGVKFIDLDTCEYIKVVFTF